ncbi:hypothetical protein BBK82_30310 [Lentzea guizhouensis]|uniref:Uncharacterized protein n=1 Tax=Lentzea guizhouensis TaxID=1586287 RepID=A0A1B2HPN5_9PSEU|nr:hypothetical protein [Lentzea guizhouensis]ANZ39702.1 hypothetical protein BBK82_30310 [Lentzea guizhouensis]
MPTKRLSFDEYGSSTVDNEFAEDTKPSYNSYYVVMPEEVRQSDVDSSPGDAEDYDDVEDYDDAVVGADYDHEPSRREPMSSAKAGNIGGISTALVAGAVPAVVFDLLPAALAGGLAAGLFGGLMGRCIGIELQQRRQRRREAEHRL